MIQIVFFIVGFVVMNWLIKHGSALANLIVSAATTITCLVLAYTHTLDEDPTVMWVLCLAAVFYLLVSFYFFNKAVPTVEEEDDA